MEEMSIIESFVEPYRDYLGMCISHSICQKSSALSRKNYQLAKLYDIEVETLEKIIVKFDEMLALSKINGTLNVKINKELEKWMLVK